MNTASTFKGGSVQVASSIIRECINYPEHEYHIVLGQKLAEQIDQQSFPGNFSFYTIPYRPATKVKGLGYSDLFLTGLEQKIKPDVVFTSSGPSYWRPLAPHLMGYNLPHYIYSDSPFFRKLSWLTRMKWKLKGQLIRSYYRKDADALVCQTDDVRDRAKKWLGINQAFTVTNTCASHYRKDSIECFEFPVEHAHKFKLLSLSGYYPHKNLEIINQIAELATARSLSDILFVVTINPEEYDLVFRESAKPYVLNLGQVKLEDGPALYRSCDAAFLPSLLECFSANYPEAMAMNKPIITADMSFARTVCKEAAVYCSPNDPQSYLDAILKVKTDITFREKLVALGQEQLNNFMTATERAAAIINICQNMWIEIKNKESEAI